MDKYHTYKFQAKKIFPSDKPNKPTKWRIIWFIGTIFFWYPTCLISATSERRYIYFSSLLLNKLHEISFSLSILTSIIIFIMIFFSLFNEKIFKYLFIAIALDYLSSHSLTILIGIRKPFDFYRDFPMQYKGSSDLYFYCFISPILSLFINSGEMFVGKEKLIGAIYCNITNIALAITMSLGIFDIKQWKVKKR